MFWGQVREDDPHWRFIDKASLDLEVCIPLWIHGDACEFQDRDSLMGIQCGSVLSVLGTAFANLFVACFPKSTTATGESELDDTWLALLQKLCYSFDCGYDGVNPLLDSNGLAFPPGGPKP